MATVAFQTMIRGQAKAATQGPAEPDARGRNSCYSYSDHSPVMALVQGGVQGGVQGAVQE